MIRSMTAFSRQEASSEAGELVLELRTVNHRYLDISLRLPEELRNLNRSCGSKLPRGWVAANWSATCVIALRSWLIRSCLWMMSG